MLNELRSIVQEVYASTDLESVLSIIVRRVKASMHTEVCSVYLRDKLGGFRLMATDGLNPSSVELVVLKLDEGLVGHVAAREEPINLDLAEDHPKYTYFPETGEERFSAFLGVPIIHQRTVMGVLVVQQAPKRKFDEGEEAFLVTMSAQLAGVIAHAEATGALRVFGPKESARFEGVSGSSGVSIGSGVVASPLADLNSVALEMCENTTDELAFFHTCLSAVRADIKQLSVTLESRLNKEERQLFEAYASMLDDTSLAQEVKLKIMDGVCASYAWSEVILEHVKTFSSMEDAYFRERASDIKDLGSRVLAYLQESTRKELIYPDQTILIGEDLTPSMLAEVPIDKLAGIVSVKGSSNSHIAILARSMGIPTVMGAVDLPFTRLSGKEMIVDGYRGNVYVDPDTSLRTSYQAMLDEDKQLVAKLEGIKNLPSQTQDGHHVALWVNTGLLADTMISLERGAQGVGLYRTEIPFMLRERFPSEKEQCKVYRDQLEAFAPYPVTMRTLDIGGDKALSYFPIEEDNPFLGWRGIRVTLDHPEIFLGQVRAMLKASEGLDNLRIMLPMVTNIDELDIARMLIDRAIEELKEEGFKIVTPAVGVMIEVPAAVFQVEAFAARVDFISVGSNDLTQYLLAVDRNNPRVADLYHSMHPSVLMALRAIVVGAHKQGVPVSICGELAGDPVGALLLMAMGYDILSMSATSLLKVKSLIRSVNLTDTQALLEDVITLPDTDAILRKLQHTLHAAGLDKIVRPSFH